MKKFVKYSSAVILIIFLLTFVGGLSYVFAVTRSVTLSESNLGYMATSVRILDAEGALLDQREYSKVYVKSDNLPNDLKNAFISVEDKRFYKHNGLDYLRIAGAAWHNIKAGSSKEGASTITQQLIKNTHLNPEKSYKRKLQEAKLALELERQYTKDEIIEMYLNAIYFGSGVYGVGEASERFFDKEPIELTLSECAALAGIVKNPSRFSPVIHYENSVERRDLVLNYMCEQDLINEGERDSAKAETLTVKYGGKNISGTRSYSRNALREAADILGMSEEYLAKSGYTVYTNMDAATQSALSSKLYANAYYKANSNGYTPDCMGLVADNARASVIAYCSTSEYSVYDLFRQPGSAIKPIAVYGPALEYGIISPGTQILDEASDFGGYSPSNYNGAYHGWVSARQALAESMNVPAVKVLSYLGTDRALYFMDRMGFTTEGENSSLSLALGGTRNGATALQMASAYSTLANQGVYRELNFVREISDPSGRTVYRADNAGEAVFSPEASYLITDMLISAAEYGTSKKLNSVGAEIAAKTGTVSAPDSSCNSDAWSLSYSTENTVCIWQGNVSNAPEKMLDGGVTGGAYPSMLARDVYKELYRNNTPADFAIPENIISLELDATAINKDHTLMLASELTPDKYRVSELFAIEFAPRETSRYYELPDMIDLNVEGKMPPVITFSALPHVTYRIYRNNLFDTALITEISGRDGLITFEDMTAPSGAVLRYYVEPVIKVAGEDIIGAPSKTVTIFTYMFVPTSTAGGEIRN